MNPFFIVANILLLLLTLYHIFVGDLKVKKLKPTSREKDEYKEIWSSVRAAWHWQSVAFVVCTTVLSMINFTDYISDYNSTIFYLMTYLFIQAVVHFISVWKSIYYKGRYVKQFYWLILLITAALLYQGNGGF